MASFPWFILLLFAFPVGGLEVIQQTYQVKSVTTDGWNRFSAVIFEVEFSQAVGIRGTGIGDLSQQTVIEEIAIELFGTESALPISTTALLGVATLDCGDGQIFTSEPLLANGTDQPFTWLLPEEELLPVPPTSDPALAFFNSFHITGDATDNFVDPSLLTAASNTRFAVMLVLEDRRECDPFAGCLFDQGLSPRLEDVDFGTCSLQFGDTVPLPPVYPTSAVLTSLGNSSDVFRGTVTDFQLKQLPVCLAHNLTAATDLFQQASLTISGSTFPSLTASFWRAIMFGLADPILSCQEVLNLVLNSTMITGSALTDRCIVDETDVTHTSDPCCNKALRFEEQCCLPRPQNYSFPSAVLINQANTILSKELKCHQPGQVAVFLTDYLLSLNDNYHPLTGCAASAQNLASPEIYNSYFEFVAQCRTILEEDAPNCLTSSQCYSDVCFSQVCDFPYSSGYAGLAHTQCFADYMTPTVAALTKLSLGVPSASRDEFVAAMVAQLWDPGCNSWWETPLLVYPSDKSPFGFEIIHWTEQTCTDFGQVCSWNYPANTTMECLDFPEPAVCAQCRGSDTCLPMYFTSRCVYSDVSETQCLALGGEFDLLLFPPWTITGITSNDLCLPPTICPAAQTSGSVFSQIGDDRCRASFCYRADITLESECVGTCDNPLVWSSTVASGICKTRDTTPTDCTTTGGTWWQGRTWWHTAYNTQESCEKGICGGGDFIFVGSDGSNCTASTDNFACSISCVMCTPQLRNTVLCTLPGVTDSCTCSNKGGDWITSLAKCKMPVNRDACLALNYTLWECDSITTVDECNACTSPECQYLQCFWNYQSVCDREDQCLNFGGSCSDQVDRAFDGSVCDSIFGRDRPASCFTACIVPPQIDTKGNVGCSQGIESTIGCILQEADNPAQCSGLGGRIYSKAISQSTCLADGQGCLETEFQPFFTQKNQTQCVGCAGAWEPAFQWTSPQWLPYSHYPLFWKKVEEIPLLTWEPIMNYTKLADVVGVAALARTRLSLQSEAQCLMNPLHSVLHLLACQCVTSPNIARADRVAEREACQATEGGVTLIPVGSAVFCAETADQIRIGGFRFSFGNNSIPKAFGCLQASMSSLPAAQFRQPQASTLSSLSLSSAVSKRVDNNYAIIDNKYGRQIGQIASNGLSLQFGQLPGITASFKVTAQNLTNQNITVQNLTICFDRNTEITLSKQDFPVLDFAIYINGHFYPLFVSSFVVNLSQSDRLMFCGVLPYSADGIYFPIYRVSNPDQAVEQYTGVEEAFIFVVAALFWIGFLLVLIITCLSLYVHGIKGFCTNLLKGKQLAVMILTLLLFFSGIRGIWLVLAGAEVLSSNSSLAVDAILTDLPIYIFFTLFMLLIFFWAEIYHFQFERKTSVLGRFKIPFVLINAFIYIFFIAIIIIYSQSSSTDQPTVEIVYKCIVASIGFIILISFMSYGTLLLYRYSQTQQDQSATRNSQFIRLTLITACCSIASLVQFIFLLLFAFIDLENVVTVLVYLFVVEVIPMYLLLFLFFHPARLSEALSTTYGSNPSRKLRQLPYLKGSPPQTPVSGEVSGEDTLDVSGQAEIATASGGEDTSG